MASSLDRAWIMVKPAMSSLASVNGPSITVRFPPEVLTRAPFELGCSPTPSRKTPAFAISSLYFNIAVMSSVLGMTPASVWLSALRMIMNFTRDLLFSTLTSNEGRQNRPASAKRLRRERPEPVYQCPAHSGLWTRQGRGGFALISLG